MRFWHHEEVHGNRLGMLFRCMSWLAVVLLTAVPVSAQRIRGTLLESGTRQPIPWASISLLDTTFAVIRTTGTDQEGRFVLQAPQPGAYYLLSESLGYKPGLDGILELGMGGSIAVEFFLRPHPLVLDSLLVALTRHRVHTQLQNTGYYDRLGQGFGTFITPEDIERRHPREVSDLFRGVPDLLVRREGPTGTRLVLFRPHIVGGNLCSPRVFVDGMQMFNDPHTEGMAPGIRLEDLVNISDIAAVEVHTRATSIPLIYGGTQEGCGVVMVWTKAYSGG